MKTMISSRQFKYVVTGKVHMFLHVTLNGSILFIPPTIEFWVWLYWIHQTVSLSGDDIFL